MTKEVIESLNSSRKEKIEALKQLQATGVEALKALDEAHAAKDEGLVSEASEKVDRVGEEIKSAQKAIEAVEEQVGWFKEYDVSDDNGVVKAIDSDKEERMRNFVANLKAVGSNASAEAKTIGEIFADILEHRGIHRQQDAQDLRADTRLMVPLAPGGVNKEAKATYKDVKSLYTNHGVELVDGSDPVPGFMGFQCGLVEDTSITCLLDPPKDDFEECISQATLNGNRIRFTREVSREDAAASVLETVYNPYPDFFRDGTKPEGIFTLETIEVHDSKIAEFVTASDEVLEDCSSTAGLINNFLFQGVNQEKRRQLIAGTGTNGQMLGILNQPDLSVRTHRDTYEGGADDDNIYDTFRRGLTDLYLQGASTSNICVVMNPRDVEIIDLTKDDLGRYLFNDTDCFNRMLRCLSIKYAVPMPQGTAVLGDFTQNWVFFVRKALEIRMGYTGDQFITNTNTILGEMRGLALVRCPRKILKVDGLA